MQQTITRALALAIAFAPLPAGAAESRIVRFDDLNLAAPAGTRQLARRIEAAARSVCGARESRPVSTSEFIQTRRCIADAKARAARSLAALVPRAAGS